MVCCILKSERIQKSILHFFTKQTNPISVGSWCVKRTEESTVEADSSVPFMHLDPTDLRYICLVKKCKMPFRTLSGLRIQSIIMSYHGCIWLLNSRVSLLASFCEQAETRNSTITQYIIMNCFPDAKVTLQQLLYFFLWNSPLRYW